MGRTTFSEPVITYSKWPIVTLEQGVKYVPGYHLVLVFLLLTFYR